MCGILYAVNFDGSPVNQTILNRFRDQRSRGIQGFGLYDRTQDHLVRSTTEDGILKWVKKYDSSDLLFHHRTPTSAPNVKNACHPFSTGKRFDRNYVLIHNGWITNANYVAGLHEKEGIVYVSQQANGEFNDSETLAWEFALYMEGLIPEIRTTGAIAMICIAKGDNGDDKLYFYHNYSCPLKAQITDSGILLASEGDGENVPKNELFTYNYKTNLLNFRELDIPSYTYIGSYDDWDKSRDRDIDVPKLPFGGLDTEEDDELDNIEKMMIGEQSETELAHNARLLEKDKGIDYAWPLTNQSVRDLWPDNCNKNLMKSAKKYYNRILHQAKGDYDIALQLMTEDSDKRQDVIDHTATSVTDKMIRKAKQQLKTIIAAEELIVRHPYWNTLDSIDPHFQIQDIAKKTTIALSGFKG